MVLEIKLQIIQKNNKNTDIKLLGTKNASLGTINRHINAFDLSCNNSSGWNLTN